MDIYIYILGIFLCIQSFPQPNDFLINFTTYGRTPWASKSSNYTGKHNTRREKDKHPSPKRDSKSRFSVQALKARASESAAIGSPRKESKHRKCETKLPFHNRIGEIPSGRKLAYLSQENVLKTKYGPKIAKVIAVWRKWHNYRSIIESKRKCKNDNEANKRCKFVISDGKIKILSSFPGGMSVDETGMKFRWYFILRLNFPSIFYFKAQLLNGTLTHYTICS
jgi:hypothetical protein